MKCCSILRVYLLQRRISLRNTMPAEAGTPELPD
ncbi:hypothetical protein LMG23992_02725 [Cupriavidus laharis]|uniref:Uncharacterized protein n=1 Tax=Cupriavidus laharis TaxID=151654 RepID=A0ABN7YRC6_9BURK|nr:hypothetical protein LMG23992_02725 [Cupriavidus laharis]